MSSACDLRNKSVWNATIGNFNPCYEQLVIEIPGYVVFLVYLSYLAGKSGRRFVSCAQGCHLQTAQYLALIISVLLLLCNVTRIIFKTVDEQHEVGSNITAGADENLSLLNVYLIQFTITAVCWLLNSLLICFGVQLLSKKPSSLYLLSIAIVLFCCSIQLRSTLVSQDLNSATLQLAVVICDAVNCVLSSIYFGLLVLTKCCNQSCLSAGGSTSFDSTVRYERSLESNPDHSVDSRLGPAGEKANCFSRLFFCWVLRLLKEGYHGRLEVHNNLFDLPRELDTEETASTFQKISRRFFQLNDERKGKDENSGFWPILKALLCAFGRRYFALGLLKLSSDLLSFAGPYFLSKLVTFIDSSTSEAPKSSYNSTDVMRTCALFESGPFCREPLINGLLYALAITVTQFTSGLLLSHFNYHLTVVSMRVRAALLFSLFHSSMHVDSAAIRYRFSKASEAKKSDVGENVADAKANSTTIIGELGNYAAVDVDRIVNVAASFHAFWSLPLQCGVVFYLLHSQIGLAFLVGVVFAALQIPLNRFVAKRIGVASTAMMQAKDLRAQKMRELLTGIRTVKLCALEKPFEDSISRSRVAELKALRTLKFLDAVCVYFWACTPLLISVCTFATYVLAGGKLTASKVFTAMSLFNMLISPLNAFPWVINGLVDAVVSMRRVSRLLLAPEFAAANYYQTVNSSEDEVAAPTSNQHSSVAFAMHDISFAWCTLPRSIQQETASEQRQEHVQVETASVENQRLSINADHDALVRTSDADEITAEDVNNSSVVLHSVSLSLKKGQLIGVVGEIGSGKSALLQAILGELFAFSGSSEAQRISVDQTLLQTGFAYSAQESWLQNASIRDNILFGRPYDATRYHSVLTACALVDDMRMLVSGDRTLVGDGGSKLSGGQKARVALARAVYADKLCYLLDDPYSAVDAHVASHIHRHLFSGSNALLSQCTRIICTHHLRFLRDADVVILLQAGRVVASGPPEQVLSLLSSDSVTTASADDSDADGAVANAEIKEKQHEDLKTIEEESAEEKETGSIRLAVYKLYVLAVGTCMTIAVLLSILFMQASRNAGDGWLSYWVSHSHDARKQLNNLSAGGDSLFTYASVPRGSPHFASLAFRYRVPAFTTFDDPILPSWHSSSGLLSSTLIDPIRNVTEIANVTDTAQDNLRFYLGVYGILALLNTFLTLLRAFTFAIGGLKAAQVLHNRLLKSVMGAQLNFFTDTPVGRILNRFTADVYAVDDSLPFIVNILLAQAFGLLGTIVITCVGLPWFAIALVPLSAVYWCIQHYYRRTSREVKRISSLTLSPIFTHFSESVGGVATIRAFRETERFEREFLEKVDVNQKANFNNQLVAIWLQTSLQLLGVAMVAFVSFIAVLQHELQFASAGVIGLAISYALSVSNQLSGTITAFTDSEKQMVSVERIQQYLDIPHEREFAGAAEEILEVPVEDPRISVRDPAQFESDWPRQGIVRFDEVCLRYGDSLPLALDKASFVTQPGEKIGIVGRTGSGKSSLFLALFGVITPESGHILVDDVDISRVPLQNLRNRLAIVPQDPFLFSGSVYQNLVCSVDSDLNAESNSEQSRLLRVETENRLRELSLFDAILSLGGLDAQVGEQGASLSIGQRQLICLIRALLRDTRVICIDEATASVDEGNEAMLHSAMRNSLRDCTALVIAHRLKTVVQFCDRVIVMRAGAPIETGEPNRLLADPDTHFHKLYYGVSDS